MTMMDEKTYKINETIIVNHSSTLGAPFVICSYFKILNSLFECTQQRTHKTSPLCLLYTQMPQIIPLSTLTLLHMCHENSTPWAIIIARICHLSIYEQTTCPNKIGGVHLWGQK
jgi:hypothetical protein